VEISFSFLPIVPKSLSMNPQAQVSLPVGFFGMHLFNRFLTAFVCEKDPAKKEYAIGIVPVLGIGFHSFIDGFIYSIAFTVSILTGFLTALGMVLHEFPQGIITCLPSVRGGLGERKAMILAFLAAAATTPLGMLLSYPFIAPSTGRPWAPCFPCRPVRWSTWAPPTSCPGRNRNAGNSAWWHGRAESWSPSSSSPPSFETRRSNRMSTGEPPIPWLDQALLDPESVFAGPEAVVEHRDLDREQKIAILRAWEHDAVEVEVAEEEGMPGPEDDLLQRVLQALARLTDGQQAPAKPQEPQ
jgi:hypothetical protein